MGVSSSSVGDTFPQMGMNNTETNDIYHIVCNEKGKYSSTAHIVECSALLTSTPLLRKNMRIKMI